VKDIGPKPGSVQLLAAIRMVNGATALVAVLVYASDAVSAYAAGRRGELSRDVSRTTVAVSSLNTALAVAGLVQSRRR
jgi:hypothetical protein